MITRIYIDGFKSFRNFEMEFTPFTVVAGLNASGKSNLFDAFELLSRLASKDLREAFPERRGSVRELFTLVEGDTYLDKMTFEVDVLVAKKVKDKWGQEADIKSPRLRYELAIERRTDAHGFEELFVSHEKLAKIPTAEDNWAKLNVPKEDAHLWKSTQAGGSSKPFVETIEKEGGAIIYLRQDGGKEGRLMVADAIKQTVLGGENSADFPHVFAMKEEMRGWRFMQLSPEELRKPTAQDPKMSYHITHSGANLASALYRIAHEDPSVLDDISIQLMRFLPEYTQVSVFNDEPNKQFIVKLKHSDGKEFTSRVLSEGTLRILTLVILKFDPEHKGVLCFEEPENGMHPLRIKQMATLLHDLSGDFEDPAAPLRQVIVNTHSPLLVEEMQQGYENASVWLSKMSTLLTDYKGKRVRFSCTTMNRVDQNGPYTIGPGEKFSLADLKAYLSCIHQP